MITVCCRAGLELLFNEQPFWSQVSRLRDLEAAAAATADNLGGLATVGPEESWLEVRKIMS